MIKYSIGMDISKNDFHACACTINSSQQVKIIRSGTFANNLKGFKQFTQWARQTCTEPQVPLLCTMEAPGVYYENCALYLFLQGFSLSVVLPNKAKKYIGALGVKTKNDKADAKALARMGAEQSLELWQPMGDFFYQLRGLTRHYQSIQQSITAFSNQQEAVAHGMYPLPHIEKSLKKTITHLQKQLEEIKQTIHNHLSSNPTVAQKVNYICTIKSVAELTAAVILAETNGFLLFKNSPQLVSYAGYDVVENQSGKHVGKTKISKKGNSRIRRALHMPALTAVRLNVGSLKTFHQRNLEKHGIKMKSYVAVQKKLLVLIYTLWKKEEPFDARYHLKTITSDEEVEHSSGHSFAEAEKK
jgi:transposase